MNAKARLYRYLTSACKMLYFPQITLLKPFLQPLNNTGIVFQVFQDTAESDNTNSFKSRTLSTPYFRRNLVKILQYNVPKIYVKLWRCKKSLSTSTLLTILYTKFQFAWNRKRSKSRVETFEDNEATPIDRLININYGKTNQRKLDLKFNQNYRSHAFSTNKWSHN